MRRAAMALLATLAVSGCGLPTSSAPERIDPARVPYRLLQTESPPPSVPATGPSTAIYLVGGERLVAAQRRVIGLNLPAEALRALLEGPTPAESARGTISDIPGETRLISLDLNKSVAAVDLSTDFGSAGGSQQVLAVAQIVYTLTASQYIDSVTFALAGKRIAVPDGSGSLSMSPRSRADYRKEAPARP